MAFDVDFFVIGAGSGGVRAARIAAGHGAKTLVAEESRIGGTCVIRGCIPKKLYVYASRFADDFRDAAGFGWSVGEPTFDWPTLVAAKDKEIGRLSDAYRENLARSGAKLVEERAIVVDPHRVRLADGREVSARHILIACGSRPAPLAGVEGLEHAITSNEIFDLPVFPRRLLVVGGGYIAVEFASLFQRLGSEVTQVMRAPNLLRGFDDDMRNGMRDAMARA
jgi:glutathione reductase (NADPH)